MQYYRVGKSLGCFVTKSAGCFGRIWLTAMSSAVSNFSTSPSPVMAAADGVPAGLWKLGRLNHVAIACHDLPKAAQFYKDILGAKVSELMPLPEHGVTTVFVELGNSKLELLHPLGDKSPIQSFLNKNASGGMHHVCIEVDNIEQAMRWVRSKNIRCLSEKPSIGAHNKPVVFLHPKDCSGVLIELEQA